MSVNVDLLKKLGMDDKEARVYLAALEFGPTTVAKIAKKSGVKRSTIYEFIDDMVIRDLIVSTVQGKRTLYTASDPENLKKLVERQSKIVDDLVPELIFLAKKSPSRPKIRFYEGIDGIKAVFEDTLKQEEDKEVIGYTNFEEAYKVMPDKFLRDYVKRRVKKGISGRGIIPSDEYAMYHLDNNKVELRETIIVPKKDLDIFIEINIYQNKLAFMSFGDEKIGIIIESQQIADTQRKIFNLLWKNLKENDKLKREIEKLKGKK